MRHRKNNGKVTVVMDGMAGSCGKGKFAGYIAIERNVTLAINNFMSNAGHTFVFDDGYEVITQHLPTSIVNLDTILCIGPGAAITPEILGKELIKYEDLLDGRSIFIHPRAMVINELHCAEERAKLRSGSTFKGCGAAQTAKMWRSDDVVLFGDYMNILEIDNDKLSDWENAIMDNVVVEDTSVMIAKHMEDNNLDYHILVEGSQGADLDINYGLDYPHTTSRQCNVAQLVADCGISPMLVTDVVMVIRPYPIRISNETNIGEKIFSGDYAGSEEISWEDVKRRCGAPEDINFGEKTTVTKKVRRVFETNWDRLEYNISINRPTEVAINFAQYLDWTIIDNRESDTDGNGKIQEFISKIGSILVKYNTTGNEYRYGHVSMIGYGARNCDVIEGK